MVRCADVISFAVFISIGNRPTAEKTDRPGGGPYGGVIQRECRGELCSPAWSVVGITGRASSSPTYRMPYERDKGTGHCLAIREFLYPRFLLQDRDPSPLSFRANAVRPHGRLLPWAYPRPMSIQLMLGPMVSVPEGFSFIHFSRNSLFSSTSSVTLISMCSAMASKSAKSSVPAM